MKVYKILVLTTLLALILRANAQNNSMFNFIIGANLTNPNQLIEGSETIDDFKLTKPYGNMYAAISYKNKYILGFGKELNEYTLESKYPKDFYVFAKYILLKDSTKFKPYLEIGYVLNTYGSDRYNYKSQNSYMYGIGIIYNINKIINLDLNMGIQHRDMELEDKAYWSNNKTNISLDRFIFKTGLVFKIF